jgi:hypothetical protein
METLLFIALALTLIDRVWARSAGWTIGVLGVWWCVQDGRVQCSAA